MHTWMYKSHTVQPGQLERKHIGATPTRVTLARVVYAYSHVLCLVTVEAAVCCACTAGEAVCGCLGLLGFQCKADCITLYCMGASVPGTLPGREQYQNTCAVLGTAAYREGDMSVLLLE